MSEWQTIDSAPKTCEQMLFGQETGPKILLWSKEWGHTIAFWNGNFWDDGDFQSSMEGFTHWMPLPTPPATV